MYGTCIVYFVCMYMWNGNTRVSWGWFFWKEKNYYEWLLKWKVWCVVHARNEPWDSRQILVCMWNSEFSIILYSISISIYHFQFAFIPAPIFRIYTFQSLPFLSHFFFRCWWKELRSPHIYVNELWEKFSQNINRFKYSFGTLGRIRAALIHPVRIYFIVYVLYERIYIVHF